MAQPADWYADPSGRYQNRYWDGTQWTNQVSSGGPTAIDPNPLPENLVNTPPAPGTQASPLQPEPAPQPAVHVSQSSSGGTGFGMIIGAIIAVVAVIVLVIVLMSGSDDTTDTTVPDTTEAPATTAPPEE